MKIYLKRDTSEENSRYIVYTESGDEKYKVVGKRKASFERTYVMLKDDCVAKIRDTHLGVIRTYYVTTKENNFHIVMTLSRDKVSIAYHGVSLHIRGDVLNKSYDILNIDNSVVACVCRRFSDKGDALEININDNNFEMACIASAICLDSVCTTDSLVLQAT